MNLSATCSDENCKSFFIWPLLYWLYPGSFSIFSNCHLSSCFGSADSWLMPRSKKFLFKNFVTIWKFLKGKTPRIKSYRLITLMHYTLVSHHSPYPIVMLLITRFFSPKHYTTLFCRYGLHFFNIHVQLHLNKRKLCLNEPRLHMTVLLLYLSICGLCVSF